MPQLPTIPEFITVHLGPPDSDAENVTVPFFDYEKYSAGWGYIYDDRFDDADYIIQIPLVDENCQKWRYTLSLFFKAYDFLGSYVYDNVKYQGQSASDRIRWIQVADPNEKNELGMPYIEYTEIVNDLLRRVEDPSAVKGVGFDGEKFFLAYEILDPEPPQESETTVWQ